LYSIHKITASLILSSKIISFLGHWKTFLAPASSVFYGVQQGGRVVRDPTSKKKCLHKLLADVV